MVKDVTSLETKALKDLNVHAYKPVVIKIEFNRALMVFSLLQLALRHPGISPQMKEIVTTIAKGIQRDLSVTPDLAELLELGWDPEYDYSEEDAVESPYRGNDGWNSWQEAHKPKNNPYRVGTFAYHDFEMGWAAAQQDHDRRERIQRGER